MTVKDIVSESNGLEVGLSVGTAKVVMATGGAYAATNLPAKSVGALSSETKR